MPPSESFLIHLFEFFGLRSVSTCEGMGAPLRNRAKEALSQTIGEAVKRTKASLSDPDIRRTWILLGDAAMKLK